MREAETPLPAKTRKSRPSPSRRFPLGFLRKEQPSLARPESEGEEKSRADLAAFILGFASLWIQVILFRRLLAAFSGTEILIGIALAAWLTGSGLGSLLAAPARRQLSAPANFVALLFTGAGLFALLATPASARLKIWLGATPGEIAPLPLLLAASFLLTAPAGFLFGSAFSPITLLHKQTANPAGRVYALESVGAAVAGLILALWFSRPADPFLPGLVIALLLAATSFLLCRPGERGSQTALAASSFSAVLALLILFDFLRGGPSLQLYEKLYWSGRQALPGFDSRYGYLAAVQAGSEITLFHDGMPAATFPDPAADEPLAHLPLVMAETPLRVLVIGGGFSGLASEILKHPIERLDYFQLDPGALELERRWVPTFSSVARDPRAEIRLGDAQRWLQREDTFYNVVIVNLPPPFTASLNRYFTAEFFATVKTSLLPGGVFAFTSGSIPPNRSLSPAGLGLLAGAVATAQEFFPRVEILPLGQTIILAGDKSTPFTRDPEAIAARLQALNIQTYYTAPGFLAPDLEPGLHAELQQQLQAASAPLNRDLHPRCFLYGLMLWAERTSPSLLRLLQHLAALPSAALLVIPLGMGAGALPFLRPAPRRRLPLFMVAVAGFSGMISEVSLLVAYQVRVGALYFALSLLTAGFMLGLAGGAAVGNRLPLGGGRLLAGALAGWCGLVILGVGKTAGPGGLGGTTFLFSLLFFGQGAVTGLIFSAAARQLGKAGEERGRSAAWLYGVELVGSALAGLLAGAVLVPVFGIMGSLLSALLAALALWGTALVFGRT